MFKERYCLEDRLYRMQTKLSVYEGQMKYVCRQLDSISDQMNSIYDAEEINMRINALREVVNDFIKNDENF